MIVSTAADATLLREKILDRKESVCGIDCETSGISLDESPASGPHGRIECWSIAWDESTAFVWANVGTWSILGRLLRGLPVVGHYIHSFDAHMFRKAGAPLGNIVGDTMRMARLLNPGAPAGLKPLMKAHLGIEPVGSFEDLFTRHKRLEDVPAAPQVKQTFRKVAGSKVPTLLGGAHSRIGSIREHIPLSEIPTTYPDLYPTLVKYARLDARATLELYHIFKRQLEGMTWELPLMTHCSNSVDSSSTAGGMKSVSQYPTWKQLAAISMGRGVSG